MNPVSPAPWPHPLVTRLTGEVLVEGEEDVEESVRQLFVRVLLWWVLNGVQEE